MKNLLPKFIIDNYRKKRYSGQFKAVGMFVDISGFTAMTESLMAHGKEGAEVLAETLFATFDPLINAVYSFKGIVTGFAGDAFTAVFPLESEDEGSKNRYSDALQVVQLINDSFEKHSLRETKFGSFNFEVKVGLADGDIEWNIIRSVEKPYQHVYFFRGTAIDNCAKAEHQAEKGDIVLSERFFIRVAELVNASPIENHHCKLKTFLTKTPKLKKVRRWNLKADDVIAFLPPEIVHLESLGEFRRVITVFISIKEVTQFDELNKFVQPVFELLQQYRGTLTRFDFGDKGCNMLIFWGTPVHFENDAQRAINFLIDLKAVVDKPFRVGVTQRLMYAGYAGGSLQGEFTCYGRGINLAARQMMKADWGEIWLDEEMATAAGPQFMIELKDNYEFKGFTEPVPVHVVKGRNLESRSLFFQGKMVGRNSELKELIEFIKPIFTSGDPEEMKEKINRFAGIVTVYGEPGIGKSRLIYEFRQQVLRQEFVWWLFCPCNEILRHSFNPFKSHLKSFFLQGKRNKELSEKDRYNLKFDNLIEEILAATDESEKRNSIIEELKRTRSILAGMIDISEPGSLWEQLEPKLRFQNILYAFKNFIIALSLIRPVVISIDDLQWMDQDSHELLKVLTRNIDEYPIAILTTSRYSDDNSKPGYQVDKEVKVHEIDLNYLTDQGIQEIAEQVLNKPIDQKVLTFLKEKTSGNPFFAEQITLNLKEQNFITLKNDQYELAQSELPEVPPTITGVLISRLDRLAMSVKQVVQTAAVLGAEFDVFLLQHMLQHDTKLEPKLKEAAQAAIWTAETDIHYIFKHALMRDAAYEMQLKSRLRQTHLLAGKSMEELYQEDVAPHYASIAYHYEKAEEVHKTMEYLEKAADRAKELYQNEQAIELYDKLIDMLRAKAGLTREELGL